MGMVDYRDLMKKSAWGVDKAKIVSNDDEKDGIVGKAYGKALYLEFREGANTNQMVITSECISPKTKAVVPMAIVSRQISDKHNKRTWRHRFSEVSFGDRLPSSPDRFVEMPLDEAIEASSQGLNRFTRYFNSMLNGNWTLPYAPIFVEVSAEDVLRIEEADTPAALIRRALRARQDAGYPTSLYND